MRAPPPPHRTSGRILGLLLLAGFLAAVGATVAVQLAKRPESSPVSRGARLAEEAGCFACHGRAEEEPRFNLRQAAPGEWRAKNNPSLWENEITKVDVLVDWITNGVPADEAEKHKNLLIRMPAYRDRLTPGEIEDLAAWILAEGMKIWADPPAVKAPAAGQKLTEEQLLLAGDALSRRHGCYQCHGELGQGGVANPGSLKGYIPGFQGRDFLQLTADGDRTEILHWIDHGRGRAVEAGLLGRVAKRYFEGQTIPMPGYRDLLTPVEKELLADYLLLLNRKGPLPAREIESLNRLINPS